jgi:hypothetical protein
MGRLVIFLYLPRIANEDYYMTNKELHVTKNTLLERIEELSKKRDHLFSTLQQLNANISAHNGAIEECQFWIQALTESGDK